MPNQNGSRMIPRKILLTQTFLVALWLTLSGIPLAMASGDSSLRDIKGPVALSHDFSIIAAVILLLLCLTGVIFIWLRAKRNKRIDVPPSLAYEMADKALEILSRGDLLKQGRIQDHYAELSNIIRRYLVNRFHVRVFQMTTEEILMATREKKPFPPEQRTLLIDLMHQCDLVKFTRYKPSPDEIEWGLRLGRKVIDQTREELASL